MDVTLKSMETPTGKVSPFFVFFDLSGFVKKKKSSCDASISSPSNTYYSTLEKTNKMSADLRFRAFS